MIIDASVWVASVLMEDAHHDVSLAFMHRVVKERQIATLPLLVWAEIAGAVSRRTGDTELGLKTAGLVTAQVWARGVPLDAALANESMRLTAKLRLRGADAVYVALAAICSEPLITLDAEMLERARGIADVFTPEQWLQKP
jgi:predicted nucleic acid-binding protein